MNLSCNSTREASEIDTVACAYVFNEEPSRAFVCNEILAKFLRVGVDAASMLCQLTLYFARVYVVTY